MISEWHPAYHPSYCAALDCADATHTEDDTNLCPFCTCPLDSRHTQTRTVVGDELRIACSYVPRGYVSSVIVTIDMAHPEKGQSE